jgi:hypothetical protein
LILNNHLTKMNINKPILTRQSHVLAIINPDDLQDEEDDFAQWIKKVPITKPEALHSIYLYVHMWMNKEEDSTFGSEFFYDGRGIFRLLNEKDRVFSEGIAEFRKKTHIFFRETAFGLMWKILPLSDVAFYKGYYDGCFTKNDDKVIEKMDRQSKELFGTFLDIVIENQTYILWMK